MINKSEQKARLKAEGKWSAFVAERTRLSATGMDAKTTRERALDLVDGMSGTKGTPPTPVVPSAPPVILPRAPKPPSPTVPKPTTDNGPKPASAASKSGEGVAEADIIRWVFDHIGNLDTMEADAPSPGAWALLDTCNVDITAKRNFYNNTWVKLLSGKNLDDEAIARREDTARVVKNLGEIEAIFIEADKSVSARERN